VKRVLYFETEVVYGNVQIMEFYDADNVQLLKIVSVKFSHSHNKKQEYWYLVRNIYIRNIRIHKITEFNQSKIS
jgi:hypothetical protein